MVKLTSARIQELKSVLTADEFNSLEFSEIKAPSLKKLGVVAIGQVREFPYRRKSTVYGVETVFKTKEDADRFINSVTKLFN